MASVNRRNWLKNSGLLLGGMVAAGRLNAAPFTSPGNKEAWQQEVNDIIRIGSNENPYGPGPMAKEAMLRAVSGSNRYPWAVTTALREKIGALYGLDANHVLMGAGSSELLGVTAALAAEKPGNAVAAYPTFRLWFTAAEHFGLTIKSIPCTAEKVHDLPAMQAAMDANTRMVYVVNPHNPTGTIVAANVLRNFVQEVTQKCLLLLDEAYTEYSDEPSLGSMVKDNPNLVVAKTFSKIHGLAGARAGYVVAHPDTINKLKNYMPWANAGTSAVSLAGAMASLDDKEFIQLTRRNSDTVKAMIQAEFKKLNIPLTQSSTSFIYYDSSRLPQDFAARCEAAGIMGVRTFEANTPWRRTSIGTQQEMEKFLGMVRQLA